MRISLLLLLALLGLVGCPTSDADGPQATAQPPTSAHQPAVKAKSTGAPSSSLQLVTTTFKVEGMDCADCGKAIETKLIGMPGVTTVSADEKAGRAIVQYDEGKVTKQQIIDAIGSLKFTAKEATP